MISLEQVTLQLGLKVLLEDTSLTIHAGQKVGLVGKNGCGKSSLFGALLGKTTFDQGEFSMPKTLQVANIAQDMPDTETPAVEYAARGHQAYAKIQDGITQAEQSGDNDALVNLYNDLADIDGYTIPSTAAKILTGLGFSQVELGQGVNTFSGGWRMRLNLARVLMSNADLMLLDEPTNHLDLEAIVWLENWIKQSEATVLLISHDRQFLDSTCNRIVHVEHQKLNSYTSNYSGFEKIRAEQMMLQQAAHVKQEKHRAHLQSFVDRFKAKASKAKQAQSRVKMLEKLDATAPLRAEAAVQFQFKDTIDPGSPMLQSRGLTLGYDKANPILNNVTFTLNNHDRIGLIGPNGAGKSTLMKLLAQQLKPFSGDYDHNSKIKVGYFAQHLMDQLDIRSNALELMLGQDEKMSDGQARKILGRYHFNKDDIFRPISSFSGGERARLVLALIIHQAPNLLLLDEPTNHLDIEVRDALNSALQTFDGATVIVSHDRFFLSSVSDQLWMVYDGEVKPFDGSIEQYQKWYNDEQKRLAQLENAPAKKQKAEKSRPSKSSNSRLQKELQKAEGDLEQQLFKLDELHQQLADPSNHEDHQRLQDLNQQNKAVQSRVDALEEDILRLMSELDG